MRVNFFFGLNHCPSQEDEGPSYIHNNGAQVGRDASSAGAEYRLTLPLVPVRGALPPTSWLHSNGGWLGRLPCGHQVVRPVTYSSHSFQSTGPIPSSLPWCSVDPVRTPPLRPPSSEASYVLLPLAPSPWGSLS